MYCTVLFFLASAFVLSEGSENDRRHPILLIPGSYGSQIEARLNKTSVVHSYCAKQKDWYKIFFNPLQFLGGLLDCYVDNFQLSYDIKTGKSGNAAGVETRVPGFGETESIEYLSSLFGRPVNVYLHDLVARLVDELGYKSGETLRGAPYDWRHSPDENQSLIGNIKNLIEAMYKHSNTSVIILSHSTGSRLAYYFLRQVDQKWKDKHVRIFISIAGSFGGQVGSLVAQTSGQYDGPFSIKPGPSIALHRSFTGFSFEIPQAVAFKDTVIFQRKGIDYTANDMPEILLQIGHTTGVLTLPRLTQLIPDFKDPGVEVICIKGKGVPTWEKITYPTEASFPLKPVIVRGDGDGIVNRISSLVCNEWANSTRGFKDQDFLSIGHRDMVRNKKVLDYLSQQVSIINADLSD